MPLNLFTFYDGRKLIYVTINQITYLLQVTILTSTLELTNVKRGFILGDRNNLVTP